MKDPSTLMQTPATGPPPRSGARPPVVERIAGWSARHRAIALIGWLVLVAGAVVIGGMLGTKNLNSYDPGQAGKAERVLSRPGVMQRDAESVLIQARNGQTVASDPQAREAIRQVTVALERMPRVATGIQSPLAAGGTALAAGGHGLISRDGRSALVTFEVAGSPDNAGQTVTGAQRAVAAVQAAHPGLRIAEAGDASVNGAINNAVSDDFRHAEVTSVPVTLVLLLVVFGALIAAGIPLLLAGTAVATAISLLAIPSRWLPIGSTTSSVVLLVGMAVGIDYSLFYLRREREERAAGASQAEALRTAAATSGRAIVVSGLTVMISLAGLFLTGIDVFTGFAVGAITVVGVAVIGSLTALPALLSLLGTWVDKGKIPFLGRRRTAARRSAFWNALVRRVVARPVLWGGTAALALLALAVPATSMRLTDPGIHDLPTSIPVVRSLLAIQNAFPGGPQPAEVVVTGKDLSGAPVRHAVAALQGRAAKTGPAAGTGHGHPARPRPGDGRLRAAGRRRHRRDVRERGWPPCATTPCPRPWARSAASATRSPASRPATTISRRSYTAGADRVRVRARAGVPAADGHVPLDHDPAHVDRAEPAVGRRRLRPDDDDLPGRPPERPAGVHARTGGSCPGCRCSCSCILFGLSMDYHVFILSRIRELRLRGWAPPRRSPAASAAARAW